MKNQNSRKLASKNNLFNFFLYMGKLRLKEHLVVQWQN